jgi:hypothetical protein
MSIETLEHCREIIDINVRVNKELYKSFDSYDRKLKWILRQLIQQTKKKYGNGLAETKKV